MSFSDRLKEAMQFRNFRQVDLCERTKIDKGTISNYLSGKYEPKAANAVLIAEALNVNPMWMLGDDSEPMEKSPNVDYLFSKEVSEPQLAYKIEWQEDFGKDITREKWDSYYDKLMKLPEEFRIDVIKNVELACTMADIQIRTSKK